MIKLENVSFRQKEKWLLSDLTFTIQSGLFHAIIGPNGAGKSTLIKLMAGAYQPSQGKICMNGKDLSSYSIPALASIRAVLSQHYPIHTPIVTDELILLGKPHQYAGLYTKMDRIKVLALLDQMKLGHLSGRYYHTLSGGEAQLIQLCRVLMQLQWDDAAEGKCLFLDEPVSHLDIQYQHAVLMIAKSLVNKGITVVAVLHDINLALEYASHIHIMKQGKLVRSTAQDHPIMPEDIRQVYGLDASIISTGENQRYMIKIHPPLQ